MPENGDARRRNQTFEAMKDKFERLTDSDKRFLNEVGKYCTQTYAGSILGAKQPSVTKYILKPNSVRPHQAHFSYPALMGNGYRISQRRPKPVWKKGNVEVVLGPDYMPESITVDDVELEFESPVWTIGEMEDIIIRYNDKK